MKVLWKFRELIPDETEINEIIEDFSHPVLEMLFQDTLETYLKNKPVDLSKFTMPILYIHGEHDPRQPLEHCKVWRKCISSVPILVLDLGYFITRERPVETTNGMMWFFNSMLGSGVKLFDRSKELGFPTNLLQHQQSFGVNSLKFD